MQPLSVFAGGCNETNRQRDKLGQVFLRVSYSSSTHPSFQNVKCCLLCICMWEKEWKWGHLSKAYLRKAEATAVEQPQQESQVHLFPWIQVCSALLRHRLEPQIGQSNVSALLESSRMWLSCATLSCRCFWFVALSKLLIIHPLSFITCLTQPALLDKLTSSSVLLWVLSRLCQNLFLPW